MIAESEKDDEHVLHESRASECLDDTRDMSRSEKAEQIVVRSSIGSRLSNVDRLSD